jgi:predicted nucleic acid-binding protein
MIAVDTSTLVAYLAGDSGKDLDLLDEALKTKQAMLPPVVLTELLSAPDLSHEIKKLLKDIPLLELSDGFWERAGESRSLVLAKGHKARIADALIAQICLDHKTPLLTRDGDFKAFARVCGLALAH